MKIWNKNGTEVTLKLSLNVVGDSTDETNFSRKLLLNTQLLLKYTSFEAS